MPPCSANRSDPPLPPFRFRPPPATDSTATLCDLSPSRQALELKQHPSTYLSGACALRRARPRRKCPRWKLPSSTQRVRRTVATRFF